MLRAATAHRFSASANLRYVIIIIITLSGRSLCWDVTVTCPLPESYVTGSAREAGAAAELAASRKEEKYANINSQYLIYRGSKKI